VCGKQPILGAPNGHLKPAFIYSVYAGEYLVMWQQSLTTIGEFPPDMGNGITADKKYGSNCLSHASQENIVQTKCQEQLVMINCGKW
jgi:hypothetical protein